MRPKGKTTTRDHPEKIKYRSTFDGLCSQRGDRVLIWGDTNTTNFTHNHCLSYSYPGGARATQQPQTHSGAGACFPPLSLSSVGWRPGCDAKRKSLGLSQPLGKEEKMAPKGVSSPSQLQVLTTDHPALPRNEGQPPTSTPTLSRWDDSNYTPDPNLCSDVIFKILL